MAQAAAGGIFVSYRRQETQHVAGRLADRLTLTFGAPRVFMDVDSIAPGADFTRAITEAVSRCDVLIALIGRQWKNVVNSDGERRLDDPDDFVVQEIRAALERDIPVIPVLVDGATMPRAKELPDSLKQLSHRHAVRLDAETFKGDMSSLLNALERMVPLIPAPGPEPQPGPRQEPGPRPEPGSAPGPQPEPGPEPGRRRLLVIAGVLVATLAVGAAAFQLIPQDSPPPSPTTTPDPPTTTAASPTPPPTPGGLPQSAPIPETTLIAPGTLQPDDTDLFLVDTTSGATTLQLTRSTANDNAPVISPDRRAFVYVQQPGGSVQQVGGILRVAAADGSGDRPLFETMPSDCPTAWRPAWNPVDARQLAVPCVDAAGVHTLRVMDVDGTEVRRLPIGFDLVDDASYSPDGATLVYWAKSRGSREGAALYSIAADGSGEPEKLTDGGATDDADAVWSPDGQQIAFRRCLTGSDPWDCDIYLMDADGENERVLAQASGADMDPTWSPDGTRIAYKSNRPDGTPSGSDHFWMVRPDGSELEQIPAMEDRFATSAPAWGPR
jgi:hypothetical protein